MQTKSVFSGHGEIFRGVLRSFAIGASLACLLPVSVFAKGHDEDKQDKKEGKGGQQQHPGKGGSKQANTAAQGARVAAPEAPRAAVVQGNKGHHQSAKANAVFQGEADAGRGAKGATRYGNARAVDVQPAVQQTLRSGSRVGSGQQMQNQIQYSQPQGTRANSYGGQWIPGDSHADWGSSGEHYWNHRHYRWYDGGWLIFSPGYDRGHATRNSVATSVQRRLSVEGYYNGSIDGDIGPQSRRAIASYQEDHRLRATGQIDRPLLVSLGLE